MTPNHPFFEVLTYPTPYSMVISNPHGSKFEVKGQKFLGVMRYPIKAKVRRQGRSCQPKVAPHRWTLEVFLDVQEGPTRHLMDFWLNYERVDLTSVGQLYLGELKSSGAGSVPNPMGGMALAIQLLPP